MDHFYQLDKKGFLPRFRYFDLKFLELKNGMYEMYLRLA